MCAVPAKTLVCKCLKFPKFFTFKPKVKTVVGKLQELCQDILSHFVDNLNYGLSVAKPNNNCLLRKKNTKGLILEQKGTRMAEDDQD